MCIYIYTYGCVQPLPLANPNAPYLWNGTCSIGYGTAHWNWVWNNSG